MVTKEFNPTRPAPHPIGDSVPRIDAQEKVTGAAIFTDDFQFGPGLLYARIKRSPHPHALIKSIDVSKARKLPGVKAVVTGADFPGYLGLYLQDRHIFCRDRVRYVGDPVVGVAAVSEEVAEQALELIEIKYELLLVRDPNSAPAEAPCSPDLDKYAVYLSFSRRRIPTSPTILRSARVMSTAPGKTVPRLSSALTAFHISSTFPSSRMSPSLAPNRMARSPCGAAPSHPSHNAI
jgi:hypothetical protein